MVVTGTFYGALGPESDETAELGMIHHMQMHVVTFVVLVLGDVHHIIRVSKGNMTIQDLLLVHG